MVKTFILEEKAGIWEAREAGTTARITFGADRELTLERLADHPAVSVGDQVDVIRAGRRTRMTLRARTVPDPAPAPLSIAE